MSQHGLIRAYKFALERGKARCGYCNAPLTVSDKVTVIGNLSKSVVHFNCAILESEP
jgi:uncharacterized protein with PIN domain